jgi:hypothetical protein
VLIRQAMLGCRVDGGGGGGPRDVHQDAEVVAAVLAGLPDALGGRGMAVRVAELARAGITPDWMPGAVPRCVPAELRDGPGGPRARLGRGSRGLRPLRRRLPVTGRRPLRCE